MQTYSFIFTEELTLAQSLRLNENDIFLFSFVVKRTFQRHGLAEFEFSTEPCKVRKEVKKSDSNFLDLLLSAY